MGFKTPKITKKKCEQVIDLGDLFGVDATDADAFKQSLAQAIIDRIVKRTEDGVAYGGGKLKSPYSKEYQKSLKFKAAGKKASEITMELTGDMLASIDVLDISGNKVKIGIDDELQNLKAFNHNTGDTVPRRPFFGITKKELLDIGSDFIDDIQKLQSGGDLMTPRQQKLLDLLDSFGSGDGVVSVDDSFDAD